jgi:hypothetical protein
MTPEQYLDPDIVYRFNATLYAAWDTHKLGTLDGAKKIATVIPVFFSKATRTFHWISVLPSRWIHFSKNIPDPFLSTLQVMLRDTSGTFPNAWKEFVDDLPPLAAYTRAAQTVEEWMKHPDSLPPSLYRAILLLYSGYHQTARNKNIEGVAYRLLETQDSKAFPVQGELPRLENSDLFDQIRVDSAGIYKEQLLLLHDLDWPAGTTPSPGSLKTMKAMKASEEIARSFLKFLLPDFEKTTNKLPWVISVPLFDSWLPEAEKQSGTHVTLTGAGSIRGVFLMLFEKRCHRDEWLSQRYRDFVETMPRFSAEIAESGQTLALTAPIQPPYDLLDHFLSVLRYVQDWESAAVFADGQFQYSYVRREPKGQSVKWQWERERSDKDEDRGAPTHKSEEIEGETPWWYMWWTPDLWNSELISGLGESERVFFRTTMIRFKFPKAVRIPEDPDNRKFLREGYLREQLELMRRLIPAVHARRSALRNAVSAIMGRNMSHNIGSHVLARAGYANDENVLPTHVRPLIRYLQERMDFLAELASGNVTREEPFDIRDVVEEVFLNKHESGQEVIANGALESASQGPLAAACADPAKRATAEETLVEEKSGAKYTQDSLGQSLIQAHITGLDGMDLTVGVADSGGLARDAVSIRGGRTGLHALYVIIENVIRNSAKHDFIHKGTVEVTTDQQSIKRLIFREFSSPKTLGFEIRSSTRVVLPAPKEVLPLRCKPDTDGDKGYKVALEFGDFVPRSWTQEFTFPLPLDCGDPIPKYRLDVRLKLVPSEISGYDRLRIWDLKGNAVRRDPTTGGWFSICAKIKEQLDESMLGPDNRINEKAWGLREMVICAAHLKGMPLEDLESIRSSEILRPLLVDDKGEEIEIAKDGHCVSIRPGESSYPLQNQAVNLAYEFAVPTAKVAAIYKCVPNASEKARQGRWHAGCLFREYSAADMKEDQQVLSSPLPHLCVVKPLKIVHNSQFPILSIEYTEELARDLMASHSAQKAQAKIFGEAAKVPLRSGEIPAKAKIVVRNGRGAPTCISDSSEPHAPLIRFQDHHFADALGQAHFEQFTRAFISGQKILLKLTHRTERNHEETSFLHQIKISSLTRIVILDERVQQHAYSPEQVDSHCALKRHEHLKRMRVFVPDPKELRLDVPTVAPLLQYLETVHAQCGWDMLVVHQTVLEKLTGNLDTRERVRERLHAILEASGYERDNPEHLQRIVVCSGRGLVRDAPPEVRTIGLSPVLHSAIARQSKWALWRSLIAARGNAIHEK